MGKVISRPDGRQEVGVNFFLVYDAKGGLESIAMAETLDEAQKAAPPFRRVVPVMTAPVEDVARIFLPMMYTALFNMQNALAGLVQLTAQAAARGPVKLS